MERLCNNFILTSRLFPLSKWDLQNAKYIPNCCCLVKFSKEKKTLKRQNTFVFSWLERNQMVLPIMHFEQIHGWGTDPSAPPVSIQLCNCIHPYFVFLLHIIHGLFISWSWSCQFCKPKAKSGSHHQIKWLFFLCTWQTRRLDDQCL